LVLVDIGTGDGTALAALDRQVGLIAAAVPEARLAMVSLCDPDRREFGIGAIGAPKATPQSTQGPAVWSVPTSTTTRHDGLVTLADFAALTPADALLAASHPEPPGRSRIAALAADARHAVLAAAIAPWTYAALGIAGFAALIPLVPFARSGHLPARAAWARIWLIIGALPVATLLANLVPWWRTGPAGLTFALIAGTMAVLTCLAALALPRRLRPAGPPAVVAGVTFAAVAIDAATGNSLGWGAPLGPNLVLGRRYFGIPNVEFALLAASALVLIALALSGFRLRSVRERVAFALIAAAMGVGATVVDAAPTLGADLGGSAAIIPSFAVFAMVGLHVRFSWRRASGVVGLGGAVFAAVALVDWRRGPGAWTHAGAFVEGLLGGEGGDVIVRKALSSLMLTAVALVLAIPLGVVAVRWWRAVRHTEGVRNYRLAIPLAGACLAGLTAMVALGAVVNDSGLAGTSMGFALAGPLLLAAAPPPLP
jgi:hypothetical protein